MSGGNISRFVASTPEGLVEIGISVDGTRIEGEQNSPAPGPIAFITVFGSMVLACGDGPAGENGRIHSFRSTAPFAPLELLGSWSTEGVTPCFASIGPRSDQVAVCNFRGLGGRESRGSVVIFPLARDGSLGPVRRRIEFPGKGARSPRQNASHPHSAAFTTSPNRLRVADLGTDSLWSVGLEDPAAEPLRMPLPPGSGPRHLVVLKNGHEIFLNTEMTNELFWFQPLDGIEGGDGLREVARASLLPEGVKSAAAADLQLSPDHRFLYASLRGPDRIVAFRVDPKAQTLDPAGDFQVGGEGPRTLAISGDGNFLMVANTGARSLHLFRRNLETGSLTELPLDLPSAVNVAAMDRP